MIRWLINIFDKYIVGCNHSFGNETQVNMYAESNLDIPVYRKFVKFCIKCGKKSVRKI